MKRTKQNQRIGRKIRDGEYIYIWAPNHPFSVMNKYVREHKLVLEKWLRENEPDNPFLIEIDGILYLKPYPECVVHHKNGIKDDNRVENLEVMTGEENTKRFFLEEKVKVKLRSELPPIEMSGFKVKSQLGVPTIHDGLNP